MKKGAKDSKSIEYPGNQPIPVADINVASSRLHLGSSAGIPCLSILGLFLKSPGSALPTFKLDTLPNSNTGHLVHFDLSLVKTISILGV